MTHSVSQMISPRSGKSGGSASAAASETAPRSPAQPSTMRNRQPDPAGALGLATVERADQ